MWSQATKSKGSKFLGHHLMPSLAQSSFEAFHVSGGEILQLTFIGVRILTSPEYRALHLHLLLILLVGQK